MKFGRVPLIVLGLVCILVISSILILFLTSTAPSEDDGSNLNLDKDLYDQAMQEVYSGVIGDHSTPGIVTAPHNISHRSVTNEFDGYSLMTPIDWSIDDSNVPSVLIFRDEGIKVTTFRQDLDLSFENFWNYRNYSIYNIRSNYGPINLISQEVLSIGDWDFDVIRYEREPLDSLEVDLNQYSYYNIRTDDDIVFSFILKSDPDDLMDDVIVMESTLATFQILEDRKEFSKPPIPEPTLESVAIEGIPSTLSIQADEKLMGIFHKPHNDYWEELNDLETKLDFDFDLVMDYFNFNIPYTEAEEYIKKHHEDGHVFLLTFQPYISSHGEDYDGDVVMYDLLKGDYDRFLMDWAIGLKDLGEPVFLRFGNEMNGDWTQWCSWFYGLDPDIFIMAWARVHAIFDQIGADNVQFVWNPHDRTYPDYDWQAQHLYYPGDDLVDWIGLTAYNNGVTRPTEHWRDFDECYGDLYDDYMRRYSSKPFLITEFACNEIGGDKAKWITEGLDSLFHEYPNIWMAVWWNGVDETWIYDIDSSEESLEAFKEAMKDDSVVRDAVKPE